MGVDWPVTHTTSVSTRPDQSHSLRHSRHRNWGCGSRSSLARSSSSENQSGSRTSTSAPAQIGQVSIVPAVRMLSMPPTLDLPSDIAASDPLDSGIAPAAGRIEAMSTAPMPAGVRHTVIDDAAGLASGVLVASLGLHLLSSGEVVTGGTAGLSLLLSYAFGLPFPVLFVAVNLPFFAIGIWKRGWVFTLRSLACVVAVSLLTPVQSAILGDLALPPLYAAIMGNVLAGVGLLILFRHMASLGGFNIVALIAQERLGWRAGYVQMVLDGVVVAASLFVVPPIVVAISALGAVILNGILALNHRPGRYTGY